MTGTVTLSMLASEGSSRSSGEPANPKWNMGDVVRGRLYAAGMEQNFVEEKTALFAKAADKLLELGRAPGTKAVSVWSPGRIEIGNKQSDYAGGRCLFCCADKGFAALSVDRDDDYCYIYTRMDRGREYRTFAMRMTEGCNTYATGHWTEYAARTIRRLAKNFNIRKGVDITVECDLPETSGMAMSSAVVCFMWMILAERNDIRTSAAYKENIGTQEQLYTYLGCIENGQNFSDLLGESGIGNFGGSEDHTAIMCGKMGSMAMYSFCPPVFEETYTFPHSLTFVIAVSGATPLKKDDDYNNPHYLARDAASAWCDATGGLRKIITFVPGVSNLGEVVHHVREHYGSMGNGAELDAQVKRAVGDSISKMDDGANYGPSGKGAWSCYSKGRMRMRFDQFFDESELFTPNLADAISGRDYDGIGKWSSESDQRIAPSLREKVPEAAWLPQEARRLGAIGASCFGEDAGGCCWAIVEKYNSKEFAEKWRSAYISRFPDCRETCEFFVSFPSTGAIMIG